MQERIINLEKPDEIISEIFHDNSDVLNKFYTNFSKELQEFAQLFTEAYKKNLELDQLVKNTENKQKAYVSAITYLLLDNLLTSVKLLVLGYDIPSGNLMRQVIESIALASLCSTKEKIQIKIKGKTKNIHFYTSFVNHKSEAQSHFALKYLEDNYIKLNIKKRAIDSLKKTRQLYHNFSHPGEMSLSSLVSFEQRGKIYICGGFDHGKIKQYKIEIMLRISLCKILPNFFQGLINNVNQLE
jgi:hypothetical protein